MNYAQDKGKIFTQFVSKDTIWAIIQTQSHRIQGLVYVRPDQRLKDEMNSAEQFLAVSDVTITSLEGGDMYRCNFILVNRDHIVWMIPMDEPTRPETSSKDGAG
jgi:hypothetical protein